MQVVHDYDGQTGAYLGSRTLERPKGVGLPANSTTIAPPQATEGYAARWIGTGWEILEDHRGTTLWRKEDKSAFEFLELGPVPADCTDVEPGTYDMWYEAAGAWATDLEALRHAHGNAVRAERDRRLTASDRYALPDYPHADDAARQAWIEYRQALRDVPEQEAFPWSGVSDPAVPWPVEPVGG